MIKNAKLVYKVNYLGGDETRKLKIGLTYNTTEKLTSYISKILLESSSRDLSQKEFEDFIEE